MSGKFSTSNQRRIFRAFQAVTQTPLQQIDFRAERVRRGELHGRAPRVDEVFRSETPSMPHLIARVFSNRRQTTTTISASTKPPIRTCNGLGSGIQFQTTETATSEAILPMAL